jgi:thiamine biosynthesis lipoprotein
VENHHVLSPVANGFIKSAEPVIAMLDAGNPASEISKMNSAGITGRFPLSRGTFRLLDMVRQYSAMTGFAFDYTSASLELLWAEGIPDERALEQQLNTTGMRHVDINESGSIALTSSGVNIDLGDLAFAYALDLGVVDLRRRVTGPYAIAFDGMARREGVFPADMTPAIKLNLNDGRANRFLGEIQLMHHASVVTRTISARSLRLDAKPVPLIDPRTGYPARGAAMVVVAGPLTVKAYVLAEALLIAGKDRANRILANFPGYDVMIVNTSDASECWMTPMMEPAFIPAASSTMIIRSLIDE